MPHPSQDTNHPPNIALDATGKPATRIRDSFGCTKCPERWTGRTTAHCSACHRTFTGPSAFDAHRTGSHANNTRRCLDPDTITDQHGNKLFHKVQKRHWSGWGWRHDDTHWKA